MSGTRKKILPIATPAIPCKLALDDADENGNVPFAGLARSAKPIQSWFGNVYHDFDGMRFSGRVPVDYCHEDGVEETLGYCNAAKVNGDGLYVSGGLVPEDGDLTDKLIKKARRGVPYQMSIDTRGPMVVETVDAGASSQVNGETVEGPCDIVREWPLTRVAVCLTGRDRNTAVQLSEGDEPKITYLNQGETMTKEKDPTTVAELQEAFPKLCAEIASQGKADALAALSTDHATQLSAAKTTARAEGVNAERARVTEILQLAEAGNLGGAGNQFVTDGTTVDTARQSLFQLLAERNKAPKPDVSEGSGGDGGGDPDAELKTQYAEKSDIAAQLGVSEEQFIAAAKRNQSGGVVTV